jgi:SAM-dependent methyltransferase
MRFALVVLLSASAFAQDALAPHIEDFVKWRYAPGRTSSSAMTAQQAIEGYKAKLIAGGKSEIEADRIVRELDQNWERIEAVRWDNAFADPNSSVSRRPNRWLVEAVKGRKPGKALDIGMGFGRNSLFLAGLGWDVTGFDIAAKSVAQAQANAEKLGLSIHTLVESEERFDYGKERWDLIVDTYEFSPVRDQNQKIRDSLKPGGVWIIEGFEKAPATLFGYESGELLKRLDGMKIVKYEEVNDIADFGLRNVPVIRVVAQKR